MTKKTIKCWHFSKDDHLANGDGRLMVDGETLNVDGPILPCAHGLHGSPRAIDALAYAQGSRVSLVLLHGEVVAHGDPIDKYAASHRTQLWHGDATVTLQRFAMWCAVRALRKAKVRGISQYLQTMTEFANGVGTNADAAANAVDAAAYAARAANATYDADAAESNMQNRKLTTMLNALVRS